MREKRKKTEVIIIRMQFKRERKMQKKKWTDEIANNTVKEKIERGRNRHTDRQI